MAGDSRPRYSQFPLDMWDASAVLSDAQRAKFCFAALSLMFDGTEPGRLPGPARRLLEAYRRQLLRRRGRALERCEEPTQNLGETSQVLGQDLPGTSQVSTKNLGGFSRPLDGKPPTTRGVAGAVPAPTPKADADPVTPISISISNPISNPNAISISNGATPARDGAPRRGAGARRYEGPTAGDNPPSTGQVMAYARVQGLPHLSGRDAAEGFIAANASVGWTMPDGSPIRDWRASARSYEKRHDWGRDFSEYDTEQRSNNEGRR